MTCVLIDDDSKNLKILRSMLTAFCPGVKILGEATSAQSGIDLIKSVKPELVFLDIEMPYGNGFELLDKLMPVDFEIIFITAFDDYSLRAFKYSAIDYLLKPVDIDDLKAAINKASEKQYLKNNSQLLSNLLSNLTQDKSQHMKLAISTNDGLTFVKLGDIIRFQADRNYTILYLAGNQKVIGSKNIKEYEEMLPVEIFFRIHHSHIINLSYVKSYNKGRGGTVVMEDGANIEVAVRRKDNFLSHFKP